METINVDKNFFDIEQDAHNGTWRIEGTINDKLVTVWGGDNACDDHHSEDLVNHIYNEWDGTLYVQGYNHYTIEY